MTDVVTKAKIQGQVSIALNALATLRDAEQALDAILYSVRYGDDELDFDADTPYRAIGESYDSQSKLTHALTLLKEEIA